MCSFPTSGMWCYKVESSAAIHFQFTPTHIIDVLKIKWTVLHWKNTFQKTYHHVRFSKHFFWHDLLIHECASETYAYLCRSKSKHECNQQGYNSCKQAHAHSQLTLTCLYISCSWLRTLTEIMEHLLRINTSFLHHTRTGTYRYVYNIYIHYKDKPRRCACVYTRANSNT